MTGLPGSRYLGKTFKWQTALIDEGDPCLFVCPGSHRRYRTPEERQVRSCTISRSLKQATETA